MPDKKINELILGGPLSGTEVLPAVQAGTTVEITVADIAAAGGVVATVAANANVALSGLPVIDGRQTVAGDIVLATAQTAGAQNGPWVAASGAWSRPANFGSGTTVRVRSASVVGGTAYAGTVWTLTTASSVVVDTTVQTWVNVPMDSAVVHNTGAETVAGVKTFSVAPVVPSGAFPESAVANLVADLAGKQATIPPGTYVGESTGAGSGIPSVSLRAKGGDSTGIASSTTALNTAKTTLAALGAGIINLDPGFWGFGDSTASPGSGNRLVGAGRAATTVQALTASGSIFYITSQTDFEMSDFAVDGSLGGQSIVINDCSDFSLRRLLVKWPTSYAITLNRCSRFTLEDIEGVWSAATTSPVPFIYLLNCRNFKIIRPRARAYLLGVTQLGCVDSEIIEPDFDGQWFVLPARYSGSGGTVTYPSSTTVTDTAQPFTGANPAIGAGTTIRAMPVRIAAQSATTYEPNRILQTGATFISAGVQEGDIVVADAAPSRTLAANGTTTNGSKVLSSPTMAATYADIGGTVTGIGVGMAAVVTKVRSPSIIEVSVPSTATASASVAFTITPVASWTMVDSTPDSETVLVIDGWRNRLHNLPVVPPPASANFTVYRTLVANIASITGTTITHLGFTDLFGTAVTPASGTEYEVCYPQGGHAVMTDTVCRRNKVKGGRLKRSWGDQINMQGDNTEVLGVDVDWGQDFGIGIEAGAGSSVIGCTTRHNGTLGVWATSDCTVTGNTDIDSGWHNADTTIGIITVIGSRSMVATNHLVRSLTTVGKHPISVRAGGASISRCQIGRNLATGFTGTTVVLHPQASSVTGTEVTDLSDVTVIAGSGTVSGTVQKPAMLAPIFITSNNSVWPIPVGASYLEITAVGGGGGGGGGGSAATSATNQVGGGGGGSGGTVTQVVAVGANTTLNVQIGAGGTGGTGGAAGGNAASGAAGAGGATTVAGTGIAIGAMGGMGGAGSAATSTATVGGGYPAGALVGGGVGVGVTTAGQGGPSGYTGAGALGSAATGGGGGGAANSTNGGGGGSAGTFTGTAAAGTGGASGTTAGTNGQAAAANSGGGGGGGGGGAGSSGAGGAGGNGGSGVVVIRVVG